MRMSKVAPLALAAALVSLTACDSPPAAPPAPTCEPEGSAFDVSARPYVERYCGQCHGETPDFGAPFSLLDEDALLATRLDGARLVDRMVARVADGTMPPVGMPRMPDSDANALLRWASCGERTVTPGTGLRASRAPFLAPAAPPPGLESIDFVADEHPVGPTEVDRYQCFVFDADIPSTRFVRRFEMVYDETRVLHHLILLRDVERRTTPGSFECVDGSGMPTGSQYLYAWAPGQSAFEFPEGGLRIEPGERFLVQIHYNNGAAIPDVRDSSGVRLYLAPPEGPEYGMIAIGPLDFEIPARSRRTVSSRCTFATPTTLLAGLPHMHVTGDSFTQEIVRDGRNEALISLTGWEFETQLFYEMATTLAPGDSITTACTFDNMGSEPVTSGVRTRDEMCFNFLYATPPPPDRYCDEGDVEMPTDVRYVPGMCAPAGAPTDDEPLVRGVWIEQAEPPALTQAEVPDARWVLDSMAFYVSTRHTPIGSVDLERTYVLARGQLETRGGRLAYDTDTHNFVQSVEGPVFGGPQSNSFAGAFSGGASPATIALDCPGSGSVTFDWGIEGDLLTVGFTSRDVPGATLWPRFTFRRQP